MRFLVIDPKSGFTTIQKSEGYGDAMRKHLAANPEHEADTLKIILIDYGSQLHEFRVSRRVTYDFWTV